MQRFDASVRMRSDLTLEMWTACFSAAAILVSLPIIVLSFVFQRQFIRGILSGSLKVWRSLV